MNDLEDIDHAWKLPYLRLNRPMTIPQSELIDKSEWKTPIRLFSSAIASFKLRIYIPGVGGLSIDSWYSCSWSFSSAIVCGRS